MLTKDILKIINNKLDSIIYYLAIIGLVFFVLAAAILFYPQALQYVFVLAFFALSFTLFLTAVKIHNIKEKIDQVVLFVPKKKRNK